MGFKTGAGRILVTGGGSVNTSILQIIADVFNTPVYTQPETQNSAALGAAFRARHVIQGGEEVISFAESIKKEKTSFAQMLDGLDDKTYSCYFCDKV